MRLMVARNKVSGRAYRPRRQGAAGWKSLFEGRLEIVTEMSILALDASLFQTDCQI